MAFTAPINLSLSDRLGFLEANYAGKNCNKQNIVRRLTLGLAVSEKSCFDKKRIASCGQYQLTSTVHKGQFTDVYLGFRSGYEVEVAIKKTNEAFRRVGEREVVFLQYLAKQTGPRCSLFVQCLDHFCWNRDFFMVMKAYPISLLNMLPPVVSLPVSDAIPRAAYVDDMSHDKRRRLSDSRGGGSLPLPAIGRRRCVKEGVYQVITTIAASLSLSIVVLQQCGIVHSDIKLENVMLMRKPMSSLPLHRPVAFPSVGAGVCSETQDRHPLTPLTHTLFDVSLADFGNAFVPSEIGHIKGSGEGGVSLPIQSLPYRSPEVLCACWPVLHTHTHAMDMWSLAILVIELYRGQVLNIDSFPLMKKDPMFSAEQQQYDFVCTYIYPCQQLYKWSDGSGVTAASITGSSGGAGRTTHIVETDGYMYDFPLHVQNIRWLLMRDGEDIPDDIVEATKDHPPAVLVHWLAACLHPHPAVRLTPQTSLKHPLLLGTAHCIPHLLLRCMPNPIDAFNSSTGFPLSSTSATDVDPIAFNSTSTSCSPLTTVHAHAGPVKQMSQLPQLSHPAVHAVESDGGLSAGSKGESAEVEVKVAAHVPNSSGWCQVRTCTGTGTGAGRGTGSGSGAGAAKHSVGVAATAITSANTDASLVISGIGSTVSTSTAVDISISSDSSSNSNGCATCVDNVIYAAPRKWQPISLGPVVGPGVLSLQAPDLDPPPQHVGGAAPAPAPAPQWRPIMSGRGKQVPRNPTKPNHLT